MQFRAHWLMQVGEYVLTLCGTSQISNVAVCFVLSLATL
jgi:hypothetical protein